MAAVILASTLYSTTLLIASTLLPQMQGTMAATAGEIAWAVTFNILATAAVTPMTGWLVGRFGRQGVMMWSLLGFTVATFFCGAADSLTSLVCWRIAPGGLGAPVVPLSNAILLDSFPRRQVGMVTSIFGMAVVIGPVIGPTIGGLPGVAVHPAAGPLRRTRAAGLDGLPDLCRRHVQRPACAIAEPAPQLV